MAGKRAGCNLGGYCVHCYNGRRHQPRGERFQPVRITIRVPHSSFWVNFLAGLGFWEAWTEGMPSALNLGLGRDQRSTISCMASASHLPNKASPYCPVPLVVSSVSCNRCRTSRLGAAANLTGDVNHRFPLCVWLAGLVHLLTLLDG